MKYRWLGDTGVSVSELALGTMAFGGDADEATSKAIYGAARQRGINFFDCANVYSQGRAEEILGRLIPGCRDDILIATKACFPMGADPNARGSSKYHLVAAVEASLRRLNTDRIDVFFLHRFDDNAALDRTLRAVEDLVTAGKILYVGASNFAAWQIQKALGIAENKGFSRLCCVQPMYNLAKRTAEIEILPQAADARLGVFPYSPLGGGLLTGKYGVDRRPGAGRIVDNPMYATRYGADRNYALAQSFTALAHELGVHPVTLAIAWVKSHPAVTAPLIGGRNLDQLAPAFAAADFELDAQTRARVTALTEPPPPATDRNEEASAHNYGAILKK